MRVTVLGLCVCLSVCDISRATRWFMSNINIFSATSAREMVIFQILLVTGIKHEQTKLLISNGLS